MKVLVTGGAGFIGSHLVEALLAQGHAVRVLDNFFSGKRENLAAVKDVELIEGDVRDLDTCRKACAGSDRVWHLAAIGSVPRSVANPLDTHNANATGTLHLLVAAREAGVQRFVFASSSSVYGANPQLPREESQHPMPMSPYANSKLAAETYVRLFAQLYGLETISLRYFNVFGPRQDPASQYAAVVPKFFAALLAGESPTVFGDGEQSRDFTFVADCVAGNLLAGLADREGIAGEHFNLAAGSPTTVNVLLATIQQALGTDLPARHVPERPGDVRYSDARIDKARARLGFEPRWSLAEGIRQTAEWFLASTSPARAG